MPRSPATTVDEYIADLPADRRETIASVRRMIVENLPEGYEEGIGWGAITYSVPLAVLPDTYNRQPLCYVALAAQKKYNSLYMMSAYGLPAHMERLVSAFNEAGKKLDMGKSCIRFRTVDDLPMQTIGDMIGSVSMEQWVEWYRKSRVTTPTKRRRQS